MKRIIVVTVLFPVLLLMLALTPFAALIVAAWGFLLTLRSYPLALLKAFTQEAAKW